MDRCGDGDDFFHVHGFLPYLEVRYNTTEGADASEMISSLLEQARGLNAGTCALAQALRMKGKAG